MASQMSTPGRFYRSWPKNQEENSTETVINRLQKRIDKLSITYDGLLGQVEKIERRVNRYSMCVQHRNHVIDILMLLRNTGGPHFVSIMVKSLQKFFLTIHEFIGSLDVTSVKPSCSDGNITEVESLDAEGAALVTPGRPVTAKNNVSLRRLLYQAQLALYHTANIDVSPPEHASNTTIINALMERFDLSQNGLSYLKELLDFCGKTKSKMSPGVEEVSWKPLMCDVRGCVEVVTGWTGHQELGNILTTALRLSLDIDNISPKEVQYSPDIDSEPSPRSGGWGQEGSSPELKSKQRIRGKCGPSESAPVVLLGNGL